MMRVPNRVIPDYTLVRLTDTNQVYLSNWSTPTTAGEKSFAWTVVKGNDLFSAFVTTPVSSPSQPTGFTQWSTFYSNWIVHKSGIKVTPSMWKLVTGVTGSIQPFKVTIFPTTDAVLSTAVNPAELPYARTRRFSGNMSSITATDGTSAQTYGQQALTSIYTAQMTKKVLGYKDLADVTEVRGLLNSSPDEVWYWMIYAEALAPYDGEGTQSLPNNLVMDVQIYYKAQFMERNNIPDSEPDAE